MRNVPDDWDCYWTSCHTCGERYHQSEGGCGGCCGECGKAKDECECCEDCEGTEETCKCYSPCCGEIWKDDRCPECKEPKGDEEGQS